ncbi:Gfo/Idh/MocA family oxidoreductase [Chryseomicrobium palamuruense]|uniref:Gfo/Idh/MocA family oxidoreductase n=1 Tax=Chryseomicrobium palamuruense TaxID=682973 RepID=A0ABV8UTU0_9BACL
MNTPQVAIIGAGNIGSRHLQALSKINTSIEINVLDLNEESLIISKQRFEEVYDQRNGFVTKVNYINDVKLIPEQLDICIIATNSAIRRSVLEELISVTKIKYLILEKFLFQTIKDYDQVGKIIKSHNIKAWVNCSRRVWPLYISLSEKFKDITHVDFTVTASNLGIGCNGIHFIDLFEFLTRKEIISIESENLEIVQSKRKGYIDFTGTIIGKTSYGDKISITSYKDGDTPLLIQINSNHIRIMIDEQKEYALISEKSNDWVWEKVDFDYQFQSNLTQIVVQQLLEKSTCNLPKYDESSRMHLNILDTFFGYMNEMEDEEVEICLIT